MSRRGRNRRRSPTAASYAAAPTVRRQRRDHMARVQVDDVTWQVFKRAAGETPISELLGQLVTRHVQHHQAREAETGSLDDRELLDALHRAGELQHDLDKLVKRLEYRLELRR